jgi:hypothetical protein
MQRLFAAMLAVACVVASTRGFARDGFAHGGFGRNPAPLMEGPAPQMPAFESRIPAPLPPPVQAPIINGPVSQPHGSSALQ